MEFNFGGLDLRAVILLGGLVVCLVVVVTSFRGRAAQARVFAEGLDPAIAVHQDDALAVGRDDKAALWQDGEVVRSGQARGDFFEGTCRLSIGIEGQPKERASCRSGQDQRVAFPLQPVHARQEKRLGLRGEAGVFEKRGKLSGVGVKAHHPCADAVGDEKAAVRREDPVGKEHALQWEIAFDGPLRVEPQETPRSDKSVALYK